MTVTTSSLAEMSFINFSAYIENDHVATLLGMMSTKSLDGGEYFATGGSLRTRMKGA